MSCYYSIDGTPTSTWAFYLNDTGSTVTVNVGALSGKIGPDRARRFLDALRENEALAARLSAVALNQYPSLPVAGLLTDPIVAADFFGALDSILADADPPGIPIDPDE